MARWFLCIYTGKLTDQFLTVNESEELSSQCFVAIAAVNIAHSVTLSVNVAWVISLLKS